MKDKKIGFKDITWPLKLLVILGFANVVYLVFLLILGFAIGFLGELA